MVSNYNYESLVVKAEASCLRNVKKCLNSTCQRGSEVRGLCNMHHQRELKRVQQHEVTWEELERLGKTRAKIWRYEKALL